MHLNFGPFKIDTRGLPALTNVHVNAPVAPDRPVLVYLALASHRRADVEKWAKRLGAEVTEEFRPLYEDDPRPLDICAAVEADGFRVQVYARAAALHWPMRGLRITTMCQGEPLTAESFAARASDVTCPQCRELLGSEPTGGAS